MTMRATTHFRVSEIEDGTPFIMRGVRSEAGHDMAQAEAVVAYLREHLINIAETYLRPYR